MKVPNEHIVFSAGIYARLSVNGDERKNESIETQIEIARIYLEQQKDILFYDCYTDLGRTGMDFERPGFQRMMQDVRLGKINCIIVKDLSRFGRNHIETGNYLEKIFPFLGVRFIAVADHFDTWDRESKKDGMHVPLKNLINEMYARDIGIKVRSGKQTKQKEGGYIGGIPPYGYYMERCDGKRCLLPEAMTADIVKQIYEHYLTGNSIEAIRHWLYEQEIHSPRDYRSSGHVYRQEGELLREWTAGTIRAMLMNPVYADKSYAGVRQVILDPRVFEQAASRFRKRQRNVNQEKSAVSQPFKADGDVRIVEVFEGLVFCGSCRRKMSRKRMPKELYFCTASKRMDVFRCEGAGIFSDILLRLVETAFRQVFSDSEKQPEELIERIRLEIECQSREMRYQLYGIDKRIERMQVEKMEWYAKYRLGKVSYECFVRWKEDIGVSLKSLEKEKRDKEKLQKRMDDKMEPAFIREKIRNPADSLLRIIISTMIQKIEVYSNYRVEIVFAFRKERSD